MCNTDETHQVWLSTIIGIELINFVCYLMWAIVVPAISSNQQFIAAIWPVEHRIRLLLLWPVFCRCTSCKQRRLQSTAFSRAGLAWWCCPYSCHSVCVNCVCQQYQQKAVGNFFFWIILRKAKLLMGQLIGSFGFQTYHSQNGMQPAKWIYCAWCVCVCAVLLLILCTAAMPSPDNTPLAHSVKFAINSFQ